ncbi:MAG: M28 family peptidase [Pedobacter sp.]|nr:MAG: M28 family peptidase [Pedobacter sp.]
MIKNIIIIACIISIFLQACQSNPTENEEKVELTLVSPEFDADSAFSYVKDQVDFGPRIPSTPAHAKCAVYLEKKLKSFGAEVVVQQASVKTFDGKTHQLKNIIATLNPKKTRRVLISAHWDTRPFSDKDPDGSNRNRTFDGANDGASGVAVILEIARQIQLKEPNVGVDFALWDIEDYGNANDPSPEGNTWCLGSQYWAKHNVFLGSKPIYGINLDMVGGDGAKFNMDEVSRKYASDILSKVWGIAQEIGYSSYFVNSNSGRLTDDHYWVNQTGIPCIDIIDYNDETNFYKNWHTQLDNIHHINRNTLKAVGQVVLETIYREVNNS